MPPMQDQMDLMMADLMTLKTTVTQDQRNLNIGWIILCSKRLALFI